MKRGIFLTIVFLVSLAAALDGQVLPPTITSISPSQVVAGSPAFSLTVTGTGFQAIAVGSGFLSVSQVRWNGVALPTNYISPTQRSVTVEASRVTTPGTATVDVLNPSAPPSNSRVFTILAPLVIATSSPLPAATRGTAYSINLAASGGTPPYGNWRVVEGALPSGLTLSAAGVLSGTPTSTSTSTFQVNVDDNGAQTATRLFSLSVAAPLLTISTSSPLPAATRGTAYSINLAASGGTPPYGNWRVVEGALPSGLTLSAAGVLSGTPTSTSTSTFQVNVDDNGKQTATKAFSLSVVAPPLIISTSSPLPAATRGTAYSTNFAASGGTPPYGNWRVVEGALPSGLTLSAAGVLSGTPTSTGTGTFQVSVDDNGEQTATKAFSLSVVAPPLIITTASLPNGEVGAAYSQTLAAAGGTGSYTWSVSSGLPAGLTLNPAGLLSGTPTAEGAYSFTVTVTDAAQVSTQALLSLTIIPPPSITTASPLPGATAGTAYSLTFTATGGTGSYTSWSVSSGSPPPGMTLSAGGTLTGTTTQGGTYDFTVQVVDSAGVSGSKQFALAVTVPAAPTVSITGLADTVNPAQQPTFDVQFGSAYALPISGSITLTFAPNAVNPADDPSIQFSTGGRTANFTIAAGQTRAFPTSPPALQTGTVAGTITLTVSSLSAGGQSVLPSPAPARAIQISRAAPVITAVQVVKTATGFNVQITGYSTPRQMTQAAFVFTAAPQGNLLTSQVAVPVDGLYTTWYAGAPSVQYGSAFLYTQPFVVDGDVNAIASVSVTLSNAVGSSQPASAAF